jgi:hypothetical protein
MNLTKEKRATFTPGPWVVMGKAVLEATRYREILWLGHNTRSTIPKEEKNANARLIAAAPEMYEMCKLFEECMENLDGRDGYDASYELAKVREVLAKVEGGEG